MTGKTRDNYNANYLNYVKTQDPPTQHFKNCASAFGVGGLICCIGQFIRYMFEQLAGGAEHVFDGNDGVARRLQSILREQGIAAPAGKMGQVIFDTI